MAIESELKVIAFTDVTPPVGIAATGWTAVQIRTGIRPRTSGLVAAGLDSIVVSLDTLAGAATVQAKITSDSDGDKALGPISTAATIVTGETTATVGTATFDGSQVLIAIPAADVTLDANDGRVLVWLWLKTDAGTADVTGVRFGSRP